MSNLVRDKWEKSMSYEEYISLLERLVEEGKTTGPNQSETMAHHTKMAAQRIHKWQKIFKLNEEDAQQLDSGKKVNWLMIVEAWCGDVGQNLVPLKKIADAAGIELRLILRDENLDLIDEFLTNGGRSIPKLIAFDSETFEPLWDWGPRPQELQEWYLDKKSADDFSYEKVSEEMHLWYAKNRHKELLNEFKARLS